MGLYEPPRIDRLCGLGWPADRYCAAWGTDDHHCDQAPGHTSEHICLCGATKP